ncbi:type II secretion system protein F [Capsulimonas corticalis]|uniref:Type II secretion system protein F n=1 Tax=Capsulimonas corticalis TaxID=2219043 RepID=A0A402D1D8_9BACT|nr:type II secretion system F family protein [Capsulimonas corticalis]BDI31637.1 type II secretion system protein F [Capsulimonas corticalis]
MAQLTYDYTAMDAAGARRSGSVDAETRDAAIARLAAEGRFVLDIREASSAGGASPIATGSRKAPSRQDLALFTRRLADLSSAGLPLDRVLQVVIEQSESLTLKRVAEEALEDVRSGMSVSQALSKHPKYFNAIFTETLRAGEASGQFGDVAARLAEYQESDVMRRGQIVGALVYPAVLASTSLFVVIFLVTFVLPKLSPVFKDMGTDLPLTTKMLLGGVDFATHYWVILVTVTIGLIVGLRLWLLTPAGAYSRDKFLLNAPIIGSVIQKGTVSRFSRVLGTLVHGGVPILEALQIAGLSASNKVFQRSALLVEEEVRAGRPIAEAMRDAGAFPPVLTHMVAVGEETGNLPRMLERVSDSLDFEVDTGMRRLVALVEPIIVLTLGTFVGFVVLSVLLPIFEAQNLVK